MIVDWTGWKAGCDVIEHVFESSSAPKNGIAKMVKRKRMRHARLEFIFSLGGCVWLRGEVFQSSSVVGFPHAEDRRIQQQWRTKCIWKGSKVHDGRFPFP